MAKKIYRYAKNLSPFILNISSTKKLTVTSQRLLHAIIQALMEFIVSPLLIYRMNIVSVCVFFCCCWSFEVLWKSFKVIIIIFRKNQIKCHQVARNVSINFELYLLFFALAMVALSIIISILLPYWFCSCIITILSNPSVSCVVYPIHHPSFNNMSLFAMESGQTLF